MSLKEQLNFLQKEKPKTIGPGAQVPSLLLARETSRSTSISVLYTMAILGFNKLKKSLIGNGLMLGEELLSQNLKQINRNRLVKTQNKQLSIKIIKFLVIISPYFLNDCCLIVIEYMLRNFAIHVFQAEQLGIIFLQFWKSSQYLSLIKNISAKGPKLSWLKQLQLGNKINLAFIIKSITFNRNIFDALILYTKTYIKEEIADPQTIDLYALVSRPTTDKLVVETESLPKSDLKQFTLTILLEIMERKMNLFLKDILQFAHYCSKVELKEANDMAIMIMIFGLSKEITNPEFAMKVMKNLMNLTPQKNSLNYIMMMWQRYPLNFHPKLVEEIIKLQGFLQFASEFKKSKSIIFYTMFKCYFNQQFTSQAELLRVMGVMVEPMKRQEFLITNQSTYFSTIFNEYQSNKDALQKKERNAINGFIKTHLIYELASFGSNLQNAIKEILNIDKDETVELERIKKQHKKVRIEEEMEPQPVYEQESQEQRKEEREEKESILSIVNRKLNLQNKKIDYNHPQVKTILEGLIASYYNDKNQNSISMEQKNMLFQHRSMFPFYSEAYCSYDIAHRDFNTPVKYMVRENNISMAQKILQQPLEDMKVLEDFLFRELIRLAIMAVASWSSQNCAKALKYIGVLYGRYVHINNLEALKSISYVMNRLSTELFGTIGLEKGKFYKVLSCHTKIFVKMFRLAPTINESVRQSYEKIIEIFSSDNAYLILIGIVAALPPHSPESQELIKFLKKIFIPKLSSQVEGEQIQNMAVTVQKILIFACHMLTEGEELSEQDKNTLNAELEGSVSKKVMIDLFGLRNKQAKRMLVRKLLIFLLKLFKSAKFVNIFKENLKSINEENETKLVESYCSIYSILFRISSTINGPLQLLLQTLKQQNLTLFPLELKIDIFSSLLPQEQAYNLLADELISHPKRKFSNLQPLVDIRIAQISDGWCKFISQCMRRGFFPSHQICSQILQHEPQHNLIKFICDFMEYGGEISIKYLDQFMTIIFNVCFQENDYSLAVFYRATTSLGQLIHPYLQRIFAISVETNSPFLKQYLQKISQVLMAPSLLELFKQNHKKVINVHNFNMFLLQIVDKVSYQAISKDLKIYFGRSLNGCVSEEEDYSSMHEIQSEVIEKIALKMNEDHLRKLIREYHSWSSQKTNYDHSFIFNTRRHLLMNIMWTLERKFGSLFNNFYGFVFQGLLEDFSNFIKQFQQKKSQMAQKRERQYSQYVVDCSCRYLCKCLDGLKELFENDENAQFMDATKFDALSPKIAEIFTLTQFKQLYEQMVVNSLEPCLISFYKNTKDDYRLKYLNSQILQLLRLKDPRIQVGVYRLLQKVTKSIEHRILLLADDMVPMLMQASNSRNQGIKKSVENIIYQIQSISGQKIENYIK